MDWVNKSEILANTNTKVMKCHRNVVTIESNIRINEYKIEAKKPYLTTIPV